MKIGISSTGKDMNAQVDSRFGRCEYFLVVDIDSMNVDALSNESAHASGGAGIQAAQKMVNADVGAIITGNIGPNALQTLSAAGIKIFTGIEGTVKEAIERYTKGELSVTTAHNVDSHFGLREKRNTGKTHYGGN